MHLQHPHRGGDMPRNAARGRERQPPVVRALPAAPTRFSRATRFETTDRILTMRDLVVFRVCLYMAWVVAEGPREGLRVKPQALGVGRYLNVGVL